MLRTQQNFKLTQGYVKLAVVECILVKVQQSQVSYAALTFVFWAIRPCMPPNLLVSPGKRFMSLNYIRSGPEVYIREEMWFQFHLMSALTSRL